MQMIVILLKEYQSKLPSEISLDCGRLAASRFFNSSSPLGASQISSSPFGSSISVEQSQSSDLSSPLSLPLGEAVHNEVLLHEPQLHVGRDTFADGNKGAGESSARHRSFDASVRAALLIERLATADRKAAVQWIMKVSDWESVIKNLFRTVCHGEAIAFRASVKALAAIYNGVTDEAELQPLSKLETGDIVRLVDHLAGASQPKAERLLIILKAAALVSASSGITSGAADMQDGGNRAALSANSLLFPLLADSLLTMSKLCNELTVHIIWLLCMCHPERLREVAQLGVAHKLLLVTQMNCSSSTKKRIHDLLRAMQATSCLAPIGVSQPLIMQECKNHNAS
ncbi:hypothetical protein KP509_03G005100 [Ceratopteris richardii]|uniref:U-box domain-containing protein n=1 Tax=Ceratopteris richardii TaxID=49495 RepID=A0A8T2V438_CERRI|nr:hypothetical protein KP509_03G005100 [Ceratopteris richardii]